MLFSEQKDVASLPSGGKLYSNPSGVIALSFPELKKFCDKISSPSCRPSGGTNNVNAYGLPSLGLPFSEIFLSPFVKNYHTGKFQRSTHNQGANGKNQFLVVFFLKDQPIVVFPPFRRQSSSDVLIGNVRTDTLQPF